MTRPTFALALALASIGCGGEMIPNTEVEDTAENRAILEFVEQYRQAVEQRDVAALMGMASPQYLDDSGTPGGSDDVDYDDLHDKLARWHDTVLDVRYEIRYRRVSQNRDRVMVDYTYTGSFQLANPAEEDGGTWSRRLADNRLVLQRNGENFKILSGM